MDPIKNHPISTSPLTPILGATIAVLFASSLWGLDAWLRSHSLQAATPLQLALVEHFCALLLLIPAQFWMSRREGLLARTGEVNIRQIRPLSRTQKRGALLFIGVFGAAGGSLLSSETVQKLGPSTGLLFQMLQPLAVIFLARSVLREKEDPRSLQTAIWVAFNFVLLMVTGLARSSLDSGTWGPALLLGGLTALIWGGCTVLGKRLLFELHPLSLTLARYAIGTATLVAALGLQIFVSTGANTFTSSFQFLLSWGLWKESFGIAVFSGALPMVIYYFGLKRLPAHFATFLELLYPISSFFIPLVVSSSAGQDHSLTPIEVLSFTSVLLMLGLVIYTEITQNKRIESLQISDSVRKRPAGDNLSKSRSL